MLCKTPVRPMASYVADPSFRLFSFLGESDSTIMLKWRSRIRLFSPHCTRPFWSGDSSSPRPLKSLASFPVPIPSRKFGHWHARWAKPFPAQPLSTTSRSEEHTSELQSLMRNSYAVFCLKKKTHHSIILINKLNIMYNTDYNHN